MKISCDAQIFDLFPEAEIHGVVFDNVNLLTAGEVREWKRRAVESLRERAIDPELLTEHPSISQWREAYRKFGLKPGKFRSSVEQLYRRALKGDVIETRLPLVNLYCYLSLLQMIPAGGYDFDKIDGDIAIRLTKTGEKFQGIGEQTAAECPPGVVAYADDAGVICFGWNYRDAARTCLDDKTSKAVFFVDSAAGSTRRQAKDAVRDLTNALTAAGCRLTSIFKLNAQEREVFV